ncbi:1-phosphofructokinase family hexose kinase [Corynebacterium guangdongense]|uniref:1-phosphofructokinase n=1 Tax=Corynebacterium guangdongense TaxID=1783348 RepID=A0ABU1ZX49_9CORY|nr:1-phosphofructokinase family hexose kinase [Corynebacterium guangdongense]MDR7329512.1 1-phosphofructokinase [Corynebacterium guangdongense]WJZ18077.1 6-phosphofructokinase isozyme 2 [Corynebacterium guangdongense]
MITTLTPNPSIDQTMALSEELHRGRVHRPHEVTRTAGGKGINVTRAIALAGRSSVAVFPAPANDPFIALALESGFRFHNVDVHDLVRICMTVTEPDGTTTKFNGPGARLSANEADLLVQDFLISSYNASSVVLAGSLPPGLDMDWYSTVIEQVRAQRPEIFIAVDTSGEALWETVHGSATGTPDLIKPNSAELATLVGSDWSGDDMEAAAAEGDFAPVVAATAALRDQGISQVLVTLGGAGALLATEEGSWHASLSEPVTVVSTVGAGDAALAGYLMALHSRRSLPVALAQSVAYGTAAISLPGTQMPTPQHADARLINVVPVTV